MRAYLYFPVLALSFASVCDAVERVWGGANGANWTDPDVWTTNGVLTTAPENTDTVTINNGTTVNLTGQALTDTNRFALVQLNGNARGTLVVGPGASLPTVGLEISRSGIGPNSPGLVIADGGFINATGAVLIGTDSLNTPGSMEILNGGSFTNGNPLNAIAPFRVYGGRVLVSNATFSTAFTTYLHGSTFTSAFEIVDSTVNMTAMAIGRDVQNGAGKACRNVLRMRSGALNLSGTIEIGHTGSSSANVTGVVEQTGGVVTIGTGGAISMPVNSDATGIYELSGGVLTLQNTSDAMRLGGRDASTKGYFYLSDGVFTNKGNTLLGSLPARGGYGKFTQTGGSAFFAQPVFVGNNTNSTGEVLLAGGTLTLGSSSALSVGNATNALGLVTVSGGFLNAPGRTLNIGSSAFGRGTFVQTGGTVSNSSTVVGNAYSSNGTMILSNGLFNVAGSITAGNFSNAFGRCQVDGGVLNLTGAITLGNVTNSGGAFVMSGGAVSNTGFNAGNMVTATGSVEITGGQLYTTGEFYLGHGSVSKGAVATFSMTGGKLTTTYRFIVGSYGSGTATISGGEVEALRNPATGGTDQSVVIGRDPGTFGRLEMTGGTLKGTNELAIARDAGSTGTVYIAGGDLYFNAIRRANGLHALYLAGGTLHPYNTDVKFAFNGSLTNDIGHGDTGTLFGLSAVDKDGVERTVSVTGAFTGNGGLAKRGTGTVSLGGTLTYTGKTAVETGTLALSNTVMSLASSVIDVQSNATLDLSVNRLTPFSIVSGQILTGTGTVKGPVRLAAGATLSGGSAAAPGLLTIHGDLTLDANSTLAFNMLSGTYSRVHVAGNLTLPATANLTVNGAATTDAEGRALLTWDGDLTMPTLTKWTVTGEKDPLVVTRAHSLSLSYQRGTLFRVL